MTLDMTVKLCQRGQRGGIPRKTALPVEYQYIPQNKKMQDGDIVAKERKMW